MRPVSMLHSPISVHQKTKHRSPEFRNCDAKIAYQFGMKNKIRKLIKNSK